MNLATVREQDNVTIALRSMVTEFPDLPAANFEIKRLVTPGAYEMGVKVALHHSLGHFEQWREALGFASGDVRLRDLKNGLHCLDVAGTYAGSWVELIGFINI